jgi:hypothetical protein
VRAGRSGTAAGGGESFSASVILGIHFRRRAA